MDRKTYGSLIVLLILLTYPALAWAQYSNQVTVEISIEDVAKLGSGLVAEIANASDDDAIDIIVVCDLDTVDYAEKSQRSVRGLEITRIWDMLGGFRANATEEEILKLAQLPFVMRIDKNGEIVAHMDDARAYTHVDWWTEEYPNVDGDGDGNETGYSRDDIVIAILDSGIDQFHVDLDEGKIIAWHDVIDGSEEPFDPMGHGTHCASIMAGTGEGNWNYRGVAPAAALVGVRMMNRWGGSTDSWAIEAFQWVALNSYNYGIEIVSCSWGKPESYGDYDAIAQYADRLVTLYGLVVCTSAGNKGHLGSNSTTSPGTGKYVITTGLAIDPNEGGWSLCVNSSRGPCDDGRIKPDILAPGYEITAAMADSIDDYMPANGTSMANAFVAGLAALWLDYDYSLRWPVNDPHPHPRIKKLLMASATDVPGDNTPGVDNSYGAGRVDAWDEVWFHARDISQSSSDAPLWLDYSWYEQSHNLDDEPLWVRDPQGGSDWYKLNCYAGIFMYAVADGDPDLVLRIQLYDRYLHLICQSYPGNYRNLGHTATYTGVYYFRVLVEQYSGDYYDVDIMTSPS